MAAATMAALSTVRRKGLALKGARALVVGSGGVGCAIAASLAAAGVDQIAPVKGAVERMRKEREVANG